MSARILIIEDDHTVNQLLCEKLSHLGYQISSAADGQRGVELAIADYYDLILLDIMMPEKDGFQVLSELRQHHQTPVLILTALGGEQERIQGFKTGADDYLIKPFNMVELHLRVEAILRRTKPELFPHYGNSGQPFFAFNQQQASVCITGPRCDAEITLTLLEYDLLKVLADHAGQVLNKAFLYQNVLLREFSRYDRTLDMHISKLRKKLSLEGVPVTTIKTVRGQGYCLDTSGL